LREPGVSSAIVGASRPEQVDENVAASGIELPPEVLKQIDEVLAPVLN
jgi:aryl-alcohol dehydrogenase-like predicted oxidoreductase